MTTFLSFFWVFQIEWRDWFIMIKMIFCIFILLSSNWKYNQFVIWSKSHPISSIVCSSLTLLLNICFVLARNRIIIWYFSSSLYFLLCQVLFTYRQCWHLLVFSPFALIKWSDGYWLLQAVHTSLPYFNPFLFFLYLSFSLVLLFV